MGSFQFRIKLLKVFSICMEPRVNLNYKIVIEELKRIRCSLNKEV
jgi:hypothetical protein